MYRVDRRPREQFVQSRRRPAIDELRENISEPVLGTDDIELTGLNERSQDCPTLGALVATGKKGVLDSIRVHLDAPVIKVERQAVPMTQRITQSLRRVALLCKVIRSWRIRSRMSSDRGRLISAGLQPNQHLESQIAPSGKSLPIQPSHELI